MQEAGEEGVHHAVVEERPLVHQDALDVLAEGRVLAQQLHARFSQDGLDEQKRTCKPERRFEALCLAMRNSSNKGHT